MAGVQDFEATGIDGAVRRLADFAGGPMLIVNTASKCGFTPQFRGLETLHEDYGGRGLSVLGFPCDQFGHQEPGDEREIATFCSLKYDVRFPMFAKVNVNGAGAHPLFRYLTDRARGLFGSRRVKWNFTKFLVDRRGEVVARYGPATRPDKLRSAIDKLL